MEIQATEDQDIDTDDHNRLLRSIASLGRGKKLKKRVNQPEEAGDARSVDFEALIGSISDERHLNELKNQLTVTNRRSKVLRAPLHRQQKEKIERSIAYNQVSSEVQKWEDIIKQNRVAEKLEFPLNKIPYRLKTATEIVEERFTPRTKLEIETAKILKGSKHNLTNKEPYTEAEKELLMAMSLKEARARTAEIQKARALMSYRESKFRQQKKIKSKRYHRLLKRQQRKQLLKEFEEMKTRDPEGAKEKLELLEKDRIMERATLKHRGTNTWSKQLRLHSRRDPKTRELLEEQLRYGRELKQKQLDDSDSNEDGETQEPKTIEDLLEEADDKAERFLNFNNTNPWLRNSLGAIRGAIPSQPVTMEEPMEVSVIDQNVSNEAIVDGISTKAQPKEVEILKKIHPEEKKPKSKKKQKKKKNGAQKGGVESVNIDNLFDKLDSTVEATVLNDEDSDFEQIASSTRKAKKRKNAKSMTISNGSETKGDGKTVKTAVIESESTVPKPAESINPDEFLKVRKRARVEISSKLIEAMDEEEEQRAEEQQALVAEAFADDDVIAEFEAEKSALEEEEKAKDIDLTLPGWGEWAGPGIHAHKGKKRRSMIIKALPGPPRKDKLKPGVIISEKEDKTIRKFQVTQPPFPFTSVEEYEASIRHPIGKEWNPETALNSLIEPRISTKSGSAILPMDKKLGLKKKTEIDYDDSGDDL